MFCPRGHNRILIPTWTNHIGDAKDEMYCLGCKKWYYRETLTEKKPDE